MRVTTMVTTHAAPAWSWWLRCCALCLLGAWLNVATAQEQAFAGNWQGVWHIGMSSGKVVLKLDNTAQGAIGFTNLPGFAAETVLQKTEVQASWLSLWVQSDNSAQLSARLQLKPSGASLEGMGQYAGAGIKLELHKAD